LFIVAEVFDNFEVLAISGVSVDELTASRRLPSGLVLLLLHEFVFLHELLAPALKGDPVIRFVSLEKVFEEFGML
jgi:hypothetical protein